tara:strand:- start:9 stop:1022 length:1014 start_codon:yes stop_codon:yes gene_type:complete
MFKIDIHTHIIPENLNEIISTFNDERFLSINFIDNQNAILIKNNQNFRKISCNCWHPKKRILDFSKSNVDIQVLSTIPVLFSYWAKDKEAIQLSEFLNNHIYEVITDNKTNFLGLGTIPMQNTNLAIKEMDRCINKLNFPGVQIGTNINGQNLDEDKFLPIFEHAEKIGCSIFVHPWDMMGTSEIGKYWLPWLVGMPAETTRAICSLIFGGILEKYPNLKFAFSHGGGSFPFTLGRINHGFKVRPDLCAVNNNILPSEYIGKFYIDSLVHDKKTLEFLITIIGYEKIALGTDYPFPLGEKMPGKLIENLNISKNKKQRMLAGTAIEWLGLNEEDYIN